MNLVDRRVLEANKVVSSARITERLTDLLPNTIVNQIHLESLFKEKSNDRLVAKARLSLTRIIYGGAIETSESTVFEVVFKDRTEMPIMINVFEKTIIL